MNEIERLKKAEEAEPMAVLVIPYPKLCQTCRINTWCTYQLGVIDRVEQCPLHKAIGIIEPGCHVRYFVEEEE